MKQDHEGILPNLSVLYVEDDEDTQIELTRYLKRRIGKLYTAGDGREGLKKFNENHIDIIITDLKMPLMDGMEMVESVREKDEKVPVVITSALSDSERILNAMDLDVVKYVVKPINPQELVKILAEIGKKIFDDRQKKLLDQNQWTTKDEKIAWEKEIERKCAAILKSGTGKGPRKIQAFIQGPELSVEVFDMLTPMEKQLLKNPKHTTLVSYFRRSFYEEVKNDLEKSCSEILGIDCSFMGMDQDLKENWEALTFKIGKLY
jgi:YesN/AraC family two-component response regulator